MNKKKIYLIFSVLLLVGVLGFVGYKYFIAKTIVPFADIKMNEGKIVTVSKDSLVISFSKPDIQDGQEIDKEEEAQYSIDSQTTFYNRTTELKTEEEFRKEENDYSNWEKLSDGEKSKAGFKFPADWRKNKKISFSDLKAGDNLKLLYFKKDSKDFVLLALRLEPEAGAGAPIDNGRELKFFAEVIDLSNNQLKVKINDNLNAKITAGMELDIDLSKISNFEISAIKSEEKFRSEEIGYQQERKKIQENGGDISKLVAPEWYENKRVSGEEIHFQKGDSIRIFAFVSADGTILPSKIQKIKK